MKSVLIIGYGVVGHNLAKDLEKLQPDIYDLKLEDKRKSHYDFAFVCIDTPKMDIIDAPIDDLVECIKNNKADIFIIKSTILPGSTEKLKELTGKRVVFSPEYYGGTQHCNNFEFNFTVLGGEKKRLLSCSTVITACL